MNVPARYVTGYFAHESPEPSVSIVRQRDAHAWAEVWIDGEGWTTFDATPTGGMPGQSGALAYWSKKWEKLGDLAEAFGAWLRESPLSKIGLITASVVVLGYVINRLLAWRTSARIASSRINYSSAGREFDDLAKTFDALLKRNHAPCPSQRPWVDHLEALKHAPKQATPQQVWNKVDDAIRFARDYSTARFGGQSGPETLARLKKQLNDLK